MTSLGRTAPSRPTAAQDAGRRRLPVSRGSVAPSLFFADVPRTLRLSPQRVSERSGEKERAAPKGRPSLTAYERLVAAKARARNTPTISPPAAAAMVDHVPAWAAACVVWAPVIVAPCSCERDLSFELARLDLDTAPKLSGCSAVVAVERVVAARVPAACLGKAAAEDVRGSHNGDQCPGTNVVQ